MIANIWLLFLRCSLISSAFFDYIYFPSTRFLMDIWRQCNPLCFCCPPTYRFTIQWLTVLTLSLSDHATDTWSPCNAIASSYTSFRLLTRVVIGKLMRAIEGSVRNKLIYVQDFLQRWSHLTQLIGNWVQYLISFQNFFGGYRVFCIL